MTQEYKNIDDSARPAQKLYQDQLYGAQVLTPLAVKIIDTPEFQRLAGMRQLGFADVTYRSARHARFEHSVGVFFLSREVMRCIVQNHERFDLDHPGRLLAECFKMLPQGIDLTKVPKDYVSEQSVWRGAIEVVSTAALLHDIGHVPFGHTLEDEFTGLYARHDSLAGDRLYELLFNDDSSIRRVFSEEYEPWVAQIPNEELIRLIYVILNWKERIEPAEDFHTTLDAELKKAPSPNRRERLQNLKKWYEQFRSNAMFHPFMSDIIGNTICSDLLDYLPRDRRNLGMEVRFHERLRRYLTIREGTLYPPKEGPRLSIMVTRRGRGGQRRDVATAVLDVMRERYEMAERVFYHHKKAAASAMLAKLVEIADQVGGKPRDDALIYPAPWSPGFKDGTIPHVAHLSDSDLIEYLGKRLVVAADTEEETTRLGILQTNLYRSLRYDRREMYRTLLVIDDDLVEKSKHPITYFSDEWRGPQSKPSNQRRKAVEINLGEAAGASEGEVILYCPSPNMQSKEVNVRVEITENKILPLRIQKASFAYHGDVEVLEEYYRELWRAYVFVAPELYANPDRCKRLVDRLCEMYDFPKSDAYRKVRGIDLELDGISTDAVTTAVDQFIAQLRFHMIPRDLRGSLISAALDDETFRNILRDGNDTTKRLDDLLWISVLDGLLGSGTTCDCKAYEPSQKERLETYRSLILTGGLAAPESRKRKARHEPALFPIDEDFGAFVSFVEQRALGDDS